jgi:hypothetical protein
MIKILIKETRKVSLTKINKTSAVFEKPEIICVTSSGFISFDTKCELIKYIN